MSEETIQQQDTLGDVPPGQVSKLGNDSRTLLDDIIDGPVETPAAEPTQEVSPPVQETAPPVEEPAPPPVEEPAPQQEGDPAPPTDILPKREQAPESEEDITPREVKEGDQKAVNAWTHLKRENKEYKEQLDALKAELEEAKTVKAPEEDAVEALQSRLNEAEEKLGRLDITQTRQFHKRFQEPIMVQAQKAAKILMEAGHDQQSATNIVQQVSDPRISAEDLQDILADEPVAIQGAMLSIRTDINQLVQDRNEAVQNWRETRASLAEEEQRTATAELSEAILKDTDSALSSLKKEGSWAFVESGSDAKWNEGVVERVRAARGILRSAKPDELAKYVLDGIASPFYRTLYEAARSRADELEAQLHGIYKSRPGVGGSSFDNTGRQPKQQEGPIDPTTFLENNF